MVIFSVDFFFKRLIVEYGDIEAENISLMSLENKNKNVYSIRYSFLIFLA